MRLAPPAPPTKRPARRRLRGAPRLGQPPRWAHRLPAPFRRWFSDEFAPVARTLGARSVLLVLLLMLPALTLVYQSSPTRRIEIGAPRDSVYLTGFFDREHDPIGGFDFRWTGGEAAVVVPAAPGKGWTMTLRLNGARPEGLPPPVVTLLVDGRLVAQFETFPGPKEYTFRFERDPLPPANLTVTLRSDSTFDPPSPDDNRPLGVALDGATLVPDGRGSSWPPLWPPPLHALTVLALLVGVAATLGRLGLPHRAVALLMAIGLAASLGGHVLQPDLTAFYLRSLLLVTVTLFALLLGLRPLVRRLFAAGGVALTPRQEQALLGIFAFGAAVHLAGVFLPGFLAHDTGFQLNRLREVLSGKLLLTALSSEWGVRRTPYPPALYVILAPFAALWDDPSLALKLWPPIIDASAVFLVCYLLRRCGLPDPAPALAAFCYTLVPAGYQLLWWGFFPNLFGQWATLAVLTLAIGHWDDLARPKLFGALVLFLSLALLSHPGTFVLTLALIPILAGARAASDRDARRGAVWLLAALVVAIVAAYALYYRHFSGLLFDQLRGWFSGTSAVPDDAPGWEWRYIALRLRMFPFALYFAAACITGIALVWGRRSRGQRALGWTVIAILATATLFGAVHILAGVWVRYFVFVSPALAIGAGVAAAWLLRHGRWGRGAAYVLLGYCTAASFLFWLTITTGGARSPYP